MKATDKILTKEQIKEAKAAINSLLKLRDKIDFLEGIEDMDGHTDGLAYDAEQAVLELSDAIYGLQDIIERIDAFRNPFAEFIGKKLHYYDSWNGNSCDITIEDAEQYVGGVFFSGAGSKYGISVDDEVLDTLLKTGKAERCREINHCMVRSTWKLN